ncbi:hypothetical protein T484DRAFT_1767040 [Baffinella frigidus]|nr:hypothetical protein T484DRAFT_1767040 [Cryptophyta sp. CCMP2293]
MTIRSWSAESRVSQIFGPGLQINVGGDLTYFYFRVYDQFNNAWEPDCCEMEGDRLLASITIDMGSPEFYGLDSDERLSFDSISYQPLTRLIYHGMGLFQIQYMPWINGTFNARGSFTFYQVLAANRTLYPDAYYSFATGSALYNHYAGDEVELTIHALSSYRDGDGGTWPGVQDEPGKIFTVELWGPPGVATRSFRPTRSTGLIRWQLQLRWRSTVPGNYTVHVDYGGEAIQGDSSTEQKLLPMSPWSAPVDPFASTIEGQGLVRARTAEVATSVVATFVVRTRDIFGIFTVAEEFNTYRGDEMVNSTLLGLLGPLIRVDVISQMDGTYLGQYTATQASFPPSS